jgi:hypothetical protein
MTFNICNPSAYPSVDAKGMRYERLCVGRGMPKIEMVKKSEEMRNSCNCHIMVTNVDQL